jgi:hypothetical protein
MIICRPIGDPRSEGFKLIRKNQAALYRCDRILGKTTGAKVAPADFSKCNGVPSSRVVLKHLKSRNGETKDIALAFDQRHQRFTPAEPVEPPARADRGKLQSRLRAPWANTQPAQEDGEAHW